MWKNSPIRQVTKIANPNAARLTSRNSTSKRRGIVGAWRRARMTMGKHNVERVMINQMNAARGRYTVTVKYFTEAVKFCGTGGTLDASSIISAGELVVVAQ